MHLAAPGIAYFKKKFMATWNSGSSKCSTLLHQRLQIITFCTYEASGSTAWLYFNEKNLSYFLDGLQLMRVLASEHQTEHEKT